MLDPDAARAAVLDEHAPVVEGVLACADAVADAREHPITDGPGLAADLESLLRRVDLLSTLPAVLATAVDAAGGTLSARPVPAPPYVAVTSRGPILRATLDGERLVVTVRAFALERGPVRYVRSSSDPAAAVEAVVR